MGFAVVYGVGSARVAVSWLADRAWVQDQLAAKFDRLVGFGLFKGHAVGLFIQRKQALDVRMSDKTPRGIEMIEIEPR